LGYANKMNKSRKVIQELFVSHGKCKYTEICSKFGGGKGCDNSGVGCKRFRMFQARNIK